MSKALPFKSSYLDRSFLIKKNGQIFFKKYKTCKILSAHRDGDLPAAVDFYLSKFTVHYLKANLRHRLNLPAIIGADLKGIYWEYGIRVFKN